MKKYFFLSIASLFTGLIMAQEEKSFYDFLDHSGWVVSASHRTISDESLNLIDNDIDTYLTLVQPNKENIDLGDGGELVTTGSEVSFMIDMLADKSFDVILIRNPHTVNGPVRNIGVKDINKAKGYVVYGATDDDTEHFDLIYDTSNITSSLISWPEQLIKLDEKKVYRYIKVVVTPHNTTGDFIMVPEFDLGNLSQNKVTFEEGRSTWQLNTSHSLVDNTKYQNLFDGSTDTYIALVKPGGKLGSVDLINEPDANVNFTVDMISEKEFDVITFSYRVTAGFNLRTAGFQLSGSNDGESFTPLLSTNRTLIGKSTNDGYNIELDKKVNYRYVKCELKNWDTSGNSIQYSGFNVGKKSSTSGIVENKISSYEINSNCISLGEPIIVTSESQIKSLTLLDVTGKTRSKSLSNTIDTSTLTKGIYLLNIDDCSQVYRIIIK